MNLLETYVSELLFFIHSVIPNWGLAIIIFSVSFRLLIFPLQLISVRESKKLQKVQPALKELLEKYKESPQTYFTESGRVKRQAGVRSWVLPMMMLIQMPVFIAIFRSIPKIGSLRGSAFFWVRSLAGADPYFILPALMFLLMLWRQKGAIEKAPMPAWIMPSLSFLFMTAMPSALVIHSLVSTFIQIGGERLIGKLT